MISHEELTKILSYDPATGNFTWLIRPRARQCAEVAGTLDNYGYRHICIKGKHYKAHKLAWFHFYKQWPDSVHMDHINGNRDDNRIENLRCVSRKQNLWNQRIRKNTVSGYKWVSRDKKKWCMRIMRSGTLIRAGSYNTPEEAYTAACELAKIHDQQFFNPG